MFKLLGLFSAIITAVASTVYNTTDSIVIYYRYRTNCVSFQVSEEVDCESMYNYCENRLNTPDYYFGKDNCNQTFPHKDVVYTCCSL